MSIFDASFPAGIALGDFNNDGKPDLVAADQYGHDLTILFNQASGSHVFAYCYGDGLTANRCPCGNFGLTGHGCENSAATGGSVLAATGGTNPDTLGLMASGELSDSLSIFLQGNAAIAPTGFGDGVRCIGGHLLRLYLKTASAGIATAPQPGDPSITARSASLGDSVAPGSTRFYQVYYRDPLLSFCPPPAGDSWNVGNAIVVVW
jgi:hypothetical protein